MRVPEHPGKSYAQQTGRNPLAGGQHCIRRQCWWQLAVDNANAELCRRIPSVSLDLPGDAGVLISRRAR